MQVDIDPNLSIYALVERMQKKEPTTAMYNRRTMNVISSEIENATMIDGAPNRIFSSFQYMSKFLPQAERYARIAKRAESVYVFGVPDVAQLPEIPNLTYIPLAPRDQLAREWFLVSYSKTFATVLATEEVSRFDDPDTLRQFKGLWSLDPGMSHIVQEWLTRTVNARDMLISEADHDERTQKILINNIMRRMTDRITQKRGNLTLSESQEQLRIVIDNTLRPASA